MLESCSTFIDLVLSALAAHCVQAADAIVSVATVLVMLFLLPKILQWLREQEEHNRCEQHLVAFFTCVLLPRTGMCGLHILALGSKSYSLQECLQDIVH